MSNEMNTYEFCINMNVTGFQSQLVYFSGIAKAAWVLTAKPDVVPVRVLTAKRDVVPVRVLTARPDVLPARVLTAKPESGRLCVICCVGTLCPPSGACLCTSERINWQCSAYTIDVPALRFRRNTRHTFPEGSRHMFRRTSFVACREYSYENSS